MIKNALKADDEIPQGQEKLYGIHIDWKQWSDILEDEVTKRNIQFDKVPW
jgi:hypothetical protein